MHKDKEEVYSQQGNQYNNKEENHHKGSFQRMLYEKVIQLITKYMFYGIRFLCNKKEYRTSNMLTHMP